MRGRPREASGPPGAAGRIGGARWLTLGVAALALACLAQEGSGQGRAGRPAAAAAHLSPAFDSAFWDHWGDGRAELAGYDLVTPRYGAKRRGTAVAIFVTEPFLEAERVKADETGPETFQVMKLNLIHDFPTGIYDYNLMTSAFVALEPVGGGPGPSGGRGLPAGAPVKVSFSAQEWCGHVYEQAIFRPRGVETTLHSYFEGEADREGELPGRPGGVPEDALPIWARGLAYPAVGPGESVTVPLLTGLERSRLGHGPVEWEEAELSRSAATREVTVPAGTFTVREARAVVRGTGQRADERSWTFLVEAEAPHRIVAWETSDGERAELRGSERLAYWKLNGPGGEEALERLGFNPSGARG